MTKPRKPLDALAGKGEDSYAWAPARIREWLARGYSKAEIEEAIRRACHQTVADQRRRGQADYRALVREPPPASLAPSKPRE